MILLLAIAALLVSLHVMVRRIDEWRRQELETRLAFTRRETDEE